MFFLLCITFCIYVYVRFCQWRRIKVFSIRFLDLKWGTFFVVILTLSMRPSRAANELWAVFNRAAYMGIEHVLSNIDLGTSFSH